MSNAILPGFTTVLTLPIFVLALLGRFDRRDVFLLAAMTLLLTLSAVLSPGRAWIGQKLLGLAQTLVAMTGGLALYKVSREFSAGALRRILGAAWLAILLGAALEVLGVLRPLVTAWGELIYRVGPYRFYQADVRDLLLIGFERPRVFTSEPSLVVIAFYLALNGWLLLRPTLPRLAIAVVGTALMLALVGSPVLLISLVISGLAYWGVGTRRRNPGLPLAALVLMAGIVASISMIMPGVRNALQQRAQAAMSNAATYAMTSENIRIVFPALATVDVLSHSPILGVGISGKEVIASFSTLPFADFAGELQPTNNLALMLMYLGLLGTTLFLWIVGRWLRANGVGHRWVLVAVLLGLTQMMGGFESPRFWAYVFLVFAIFQAAPHRQRQGPVRLGPHGH